MGVDGAKVVEVLDAPGVKLNDFKKAAVEVEAEFLIIHGIGDFGDHFFGLQFFESLVD